MIGSYHDSAKMCWGRLGGVDVAECNQEPISQSQNETTYVDRNLIIGADLNRTSDDIQDAS